MFEETPGGDSQLGGMHENAVKQVQAMARTYKLALEARLGAEIRECHDIIPWLIRHSAENKNRYHVGRDGMTAHRRLRGRNFRKEICEFGECVWYLTPESGGVNELDARWKNGIFLTLRKD